MVAISPFLVSLVFAANEVLAVGTAFGQAAGTTGGGNATPQTPSSLSELTSWLSDTTARVIVLDKLFDFTSSEGSTTGKGCKPWTCSPNVQIAIDGAGWCEREYPNAPTVSITYSKAGVTALQVGSNKTLLGKGASAGLRGKGLQIKGHSNIIIQNLKIIDINAQYVWGGDAISIDGGSNIWIDHNYFQNIGRQMGVTGYGAVTATTWSNNVFNGETAWSAVCNGKHYWTLLFTGKGDSMTVANNYMYKTSGRGPHAGGTSGNFQNIHMVNNYYSEVDGHAIDAQIGAKVLAEGNYFQSVTQPVVAGEAGQAFVPISSADAAKCASALGRSCVANTLLNSGPVSAGLDSNTVDGFSGQANVRSYKVMSAQDAATYVQANAGIGKIN